MKRYFKILMVFFVFTSCSYAQEEQNLWKTEFDFGDGFVLTTFLKENKSYNELFLTSPEDGDKRIFGTIKAKIGRASGKLPKKGIFITINGVKKGDSLIGEVKNPMITDLKFNGLLRNNEIIGNLIKDDSLIIGELRATKTIKAKNEYSNLYSKILNITELNIFSKSYIETKSWKKFNRSLKKILNKAKDDIELFIGFNMISQDLPFSHYNLVFSRKQKLSTNKENNTTNITNSTIIFEEKNQNTAYLKIKNFSTSQGELASVLPKIIKNKNYKNLIIDLRNNGGGGIEAAFELAKYLINDSINIGFFITNKLNYSNFEISKFKTLPKVTPKTTDEFIEYLKQNEGAKLIFENSNTNTNVFLGNIFVLTNGNTASTCEPIAYALKNNIGATIIGEKTAGAMLSAAPFIIDEKYKLILPIADFYTSDGTRLDQKGVSPTIEVESEKALEKAMEIINSNTKKE